MAGDGPSDALPRVEGDAFLKGGALCLLAWTKDGGGVSGREIQVQHSADSDFQVQSPKIPAQAGIHGATVEPDHHGPLLAQGSAEKAAYR